jgi:putative endonuclease
MFVYIIKSEKTYKYYCGQTQNIQHRIDRHNKGLEPYTKNGVPWSLIIFFEVKNRSEAMILEKKIKKRGIQRYLQDNNLL